MTNNEALKAAFARTMDGYFSQYGISGSEKPHRFSLAYRVRRASIIRLGRMAPEKLPRKNFISLKRLSVTIAAVITAVILAAAAGASYLVSARGFSFSVNEKYSDVSVDFSMYTIKETIEEIYRLPSERGFELTYETYDSEVINSEYEYENQMVVLTQYAKIFAENLYANTENSEVYEVEVDGNPGFILVHHRSDGVVGSILTWIHDGYVFDLSVWPEDDINLIELAEMIVPEQ